MQRLNEQQTNNRILLRIVVRITEFKAINKLHTANCQRGILPFREAPLYGNKSFILVSL
jgi:hypothetical protein